MPRIRTGRIATLASRAQHAFGKKVEKVARTEEHEALEREVLRTLQEEQDEETRGILQRTLASDVAKVQDPEKIKVPKGTLQEYLEKEKLKIDHCIQLPCTLAFFISFVLAALAHEDITNVAQVERHFRGMLGGTTFEGLGGNITKLKVSGHKDMADIDLSVDIWTYLHDAIVPLMIPANASELERPSDMYRVLRYNHLIGGMQLQQIRRKRRECAAAYPDMGPKVPDSNYNPLIADVFCYPWDTYDDGCFGPGPAQDGFCPDSRILGASTRRLSEQREEGNRTQPQQQQQGRRQQQLQQQQQQQGEEDSVASSWSEAWKRRLQFGLDQHSFYAEGRTWDGITNAIGFEGSTYTVFVHPHEGLPAALGKLKVLQDNTWIDDGTAWFGVKLFVLNPDLALYAHVIAGVLLTPSGELLPSLRLTSFQAEPYQEMSRIAFDIVWLIFWFYLFCRCVSSFFKAIFFRKVRSYLLNFWNVVEWLTTIGGMVIIVNWVSFMLLLDTLKGRVADLELQRPISFLFTDHTHEERYMQRSLLLHSEAAGFAGFVAYARVFACNYTILIIVRFFKAFSIQPRLAIVTNTLAASFSEIGHFMMVLLLVMMAWSSAGMFLFGHRLLEFSEYKFALNTCFMLMMGNYNYYELSAEHPVLAALWFWSYFLFISLVLLNMALAIVLDVYSEVAADAEGADSVWVQAIEYVHRWIHRSDWLSFGQVSSALSKVTTASGNFDLADLCEALPLMPLEQATELLEGAHRMAAEEANKGLKMADALRMTAHIKDQVETVATDLDKLVESHSKTKAQRNRTAAKRRQTIREASSLRRQVVDFSPELKERLSKLEARFERFESQASESMHGTIDVCRRMRGQLAGIETGVFGRPTKEAEPPVPGPTSSWASMEPQDNMPLQNTNFTRLSWD